MRLSFNRFEPPFPSFEGTLVFPMAMLEECNSPDILQFDGFRLGGDPDIRPCL